MARAQAAPRSSDAQQLTDAVTRLRRALRASIRTEIPWESLPMAQVELLQSLAEEGATRVSDLAERLNLANSTVSGLVGQMVARGLISREPDVHDRRAAIVALSDAGREQLAGWERAHEERIRAALDCLSPDERASVHEALPALGRLAGLLNERPRT